MDLQRVKGTGRKARILKEDVRGFVKQVMAEPGGSGGSVLPPMPVIDFTKSYDSVGEPNYNSTPDGTYQVGTGGGTTMTLDFDGNANIHVDEELVFHLYGLDGRAPILVK